MFVQNFQIYRFYMLINGVIPNGESDPAGSRGNVSTYIMTHAVKKGVKIHFHFILFMENIIYNMSTRIPFIEPKMNDSRISRIIHMSSMF